MSDWHPFPGGLTASASGDGQRIVFCHGFTQTSISWRPIASSVAALGFQAVVVDLPGHGGSSDVRAGLPETADLLTEMIGPASYVGYSLGGRLCLQAALRHPELVSRLAVLGANPGIVDRGERARRVAGDELLARRVLEIGVPAFLAQWMVQPLFGTRAPDSDDVAERQTNTAEGLAASLRLAGTGAEAPTWDRLGALTMPVLVMAGERDTKYVDIAQRMAAAVPRGTFVAIPDADHAAHLHCAAAVLTLLQQWLSA